MKVRCSKSSDNCGDCIHDQVRALLDTILRAFAADLGVK